MRGQQLWGFVWRKLNQRTFSEYLKDNEVFLDNCRDPATTLWRHMNVMALHNNLKRDYLPQSLSFVRLTQTITSQFCIAGSVIGPKKYMAKNTYLNYDIPLTNVQKFWNSARINSSLTSHFCLFISFYSTIKWSVSVENYVTLVDSIQINICIKCLLLYNYFF